MYIILFNYKINLFDSNGQTCNCMCIYECTYFFCIKIEQVTNPTLLTLCMIMINLCLIARLF